MLQQCQESRRSVPPISQVVLPAPVWWHCRQWMDKANPCSTKYTPDLSLSITIILGANLHWDWLRVNLTQAGQSQSAKTLCRETCGGLNSFHRSSRCHIVSRTCSSRRRSIKAISNSMARISAWLWVNCGGLAGCPKNTGKRHIHAVALPRYCRQTINPEWLSLESWLLLL